MLYSAIHISSCWKIQDRRQIKNTDNTQTKHNPEKANNTKTQQKIYHVQSPFTTLGQKMRWAYSTGWPNKNCTFLKYHIFAATTDIIMWFC